MRHLLHRHSRTLFVDRADHWIVQLVRAVAVSLIAAVGDYALLVSAVELLNTPVVWTSVAGVVFGHIITYILHTLWIFSGHDHGYHKTQFVLFVGIGASGLLVHSGLMHLFLGISAAAEQSYVTDPEGGVVPGVSGSLNPR
jgi:putative flippase GtrA